MVIHNIYHKHIRNKVVEYLADYKMEFPSCGCSEVVIIADIAFRQLDSSGCLDEATLMLFMRLLAVSIEYLDTELQVPEDLLYFMKSIVIDLLLTEDDSTDGIIDNVCLN